MPKGHPVTPDMFRSLAAYIVARPSKPWTEISKELGHEQTYLSSLLYDHPEFADYIKEANKVWIKQLAARAVEVHAELMNGAKSEQVRLAASKSILSYGDYDAPIKQEISSNDININIGGSNAEDKSEPNEGNI